MPTALEELNHLQKRVADELDKKLRLSNKQLADITSAIVKLRAEMEGLMTEVETLRQEKVGLTQEITSKRNAAEEYRNEQLAKIETTASKLTEAEKKLRKAETEAATREQKAQAALSAYQECVGKVASSTGTLRASIVAAVDKVLSELNPPA